MDGGMGLAIIRAIVDELDVRGGDDGRGTVVHMTKFLYESVETSSAAVGQGRLERRRPGSCRSSVVISKIRSAVPLGEDHPGFAALSVTVAHRADEDTERCRVDERDRGQVCDQMVALVPGRARR